MVLYPDSYFTEYNHYHDPHTGEFAFGAHVVNPYGEVHEQTKQPSNSAWLRSTHGHMSITKHGDYLQVEHTALDSPQYAGQGEGRALYQAAFAHAKANGLKGLISSLKTSLSPYSKRAWESFERRGWAKTRVERKRIGGKDHAFEYFVIE